MSKVVIVGGGASGLVAAIYAARNRNDVLILEKKEVVGKKILATGNGRCNYFNSDQNIEHFKSAENERIKDVINKENQNEILDFFYDIGIEPKIKNGYYYPLSNQAVTVRDALLKEAQMSNVEIKTETNVQNITKEGQKFAIFNSEEKIYADKVILACGSKAALKNDYDANGYKLCEEFGINIVKPLPALVQLKGKEKFFKKWNGIRADAKVELYENGIKKIEDVGEIQLTDYGISGICVFNLSGMAIRGLDKGNKEQVKINFLFNIGLNEKEDFVKWMDMRNERIQDRTICELLYGVLNKKLVDILLKEANVDESLVWNNLSEKEKIEFARMIVDLKIDITGSNSFDKAQVCSGGVSLKEMNLLTMESKKVQDLFIVGELLDVNGDCGGYNLEWAWITGMIAGKSV